jgi:aminopeptidase
MDPRFHEFAHHIVNTATQISQGDNVLIQISDQGHDFALELYKQIVEKGGQPLLISTPTEVVRAFYDIADSETISTLPRHYYHLIKASDVIISIRSEANTKSLSNVPPHKISARAITLKPIQEERLSKRWCLTQYPTTGYAQEAAMSLREYSDFVFSAILIDWADQRRIMQELKQILDQTDEVRLIGDRTDLVMSIKGRNAVVGGPDNNVPGGEVFTAPIDDSAEGHIYFDLPAIKYGQEVEGITLHFEKGEVVDFSADRNEALLHSMLETDKGARRLGELGIGTNRGITTFTKNILFDEKIGDTIHLALGRAYKECGGTNESAIHWDMIKTMKYSQGSRMIFDGTTVHLSEDGTWILERSK